MDRKGKKNFASVSNSPFYRMGITRKIHYTISSGKDSLSEIIKIDQIV